MAARYTTSKSGQERAELDQVGTSEMAGAASARDDHAALTHFYASFSAARTSSIVG